MLLNCKIQYDIIKSKKKRSTPLFAFGEKILLKGKVKMKNNFKKLTALALGVVTAVAFTACGGTNGGNSTSGSSAGGNEQVNNEKIQLYVYNYNGGYGSEWIMNAKQRFEAAHANDEFSGGKKGVQIMVDATKDNISSKINGSNEVYFAESAYYYSLKNQGLLADITTAVTTKLDGESKSIEDKMSDSQKDFFKVDDKYYAIPHTNTFAGLTYNKDVFDAKNFYFAAEPFLTDGKVASVEDWFIAEKTDEKSAGPDGVKGTDDDGLPSTYDEFFILLEYMKQKNVQPITWNGYRYYHYLTWLFQALVADYEGYDQMMLNYTMDGTANDLGTISGGTFVKDGAPLKITANEKNDLARQAGKYYALKFLERLKNVSVDDKGNTTDIVGKKGVFNSSYTHLNAQEDFITGSNDGVNKDIGILVEGIWWENEAAPAFQTLVSKTHDQSLAAKNRNFKFMPLPNANAEITAKKASGEKKNTMIDQLFALACVKSGLSAEKQALAEEFIRFCNTDAELRAFTVCTNTPKALNYALTEDDKKNMTSFGVSVWNMKEKSDIVYPYATNSTYMNNMQHFSAFEMYSSTVSSGTQTYAIQAFRNGVSAEEYFTGLKTYLDNYHWN